MTKFSMQRAKALKQLADARNWIFIYFAYK